MVYIDPPLRHQVRLQLAGQRPKRDVKDGKVEDAAREAEQIKAFRDTWELGIHSASRTCATASSPASSPHRDGELLRPDRRRKRPPRPFPHGPRSLRPENFISQIAFLPPAALKRTSSATPVDFLLWFW